MNDLACQDGSARAREERGHKTNCDQALRRFSENIFDTSNFYSNQLKIDERAEPPPPTNYNLVGSSMMWRSSGRGRESTAAATVSVGSTGCVSPFTKRRR